MVHAQVGLPVIELGLALERLPVTFDPVPIHGSQSPGLVDIFRCTHAPLFNIPAGNNNGPTGIRVTPDGRLLVVANFNANTLSVIDAVTNSIIGSVMVGRSPQYIAILDTKRD